MQLKLQTQGAPWNHPVTALLPRHDVVYRAPVCDPTYSLPLGDGDRGALLWVTEDTLHLQLNKTDLWDDSTREDGVCSSEEENLTTCRSGAHVKWQFHCPIFESLYVKDYEARLSLADAQGLISSKTPFGQASISAFCSRTYGVTVVEVDFHAEDPLPLTVELERWGSRTLWRWYARYGAGPEKGLSGTETQARDDVLLLTQQLRSLSFCAAIQIAGERPETRRLSRHAVRGELAPAPRHKALFYLALATGGTAEEAQKAALSQLDAAAQAGRDAIRREHQAAWADFWQRSFVCFSGNETYHYAENLWYLNLYYAACQMRGAYPSHFCNGVWGFYHDYVPWNYYFHYNMQLATFPLEAAGHPELLETYYDFRFRQLPWAKQFAKERLHMPGAFYADVCDRLGRNETDVSDNCTCASQIALELYQHYLFSGQRSYLEEKALPLMEAAGEFYLAKLEKREDGFYHISGTQGYEGSPLLEDSITDHAMIRALFAALVRELPAEKAAPYAQRLSALFPYETAEMYEDEVKDGVFIRGIGRGMKARGDQVLAVGRTSGDVTMTDVGPAEGLHEWGEPDKTWKKGTLLRNTFGHPAHDYYGFPDTEMAPVFPAGLVGVKDRGTPLYNMIYNSCCLHHPALSPQEAGEDFDGMCMNWCLMPLYLARMGLDELLEKQLYQSASAWILYPQGFGEEGGHAARINARLNRFAYYEPKIVGTDKTGRVPAWPYRHFDYETLPILAAALNEMLLQSHDGVLRLFAALKPDSRVCFHLKAAGGYQVHAQFDGGECACLIECEKEGEVLLAFEQVSSPVEFFSFQTGAPLAFTCSGGVYRVKAGAGLGILAATEGAQGGRLQMDVCAEQNRNAKHLGASVLGCEPEYEL